MANINITNNDLGSVIFESGEFRDELLTVGGALTMLEGTILARDTTTQKLIAFVKGGSTAGNGVVVAVLTYEIVSTGAGDITMRAMVSGKVRVPRLVIAADGDNSNVDGNVLDDLRQTSIIPVDVGELNILDNQ
jgi:hypothetical protein